MSISLSSNPSWEDLADVLYNESVIIIKHPSVLVPHSRYESYLGILVNEMHQASLPLPVVRVILDDTE
jgi:hypothetical protein